MVSRQVGMCLPTQVIWRFLFQTSVTSDTEVGRERPNTFSSWATMHPWQRSVRKISV